MERTGSKRLATEYLRILLHGVPGSRKTFTAATASALYPLDKMVPFESPIVLEDMGWWLFDSGGLGGMEVMGLEVPNVWDFSKDSGAEVLKHLPEAIKETNEMIEAGTIKWLVIDTVSSADIKFQVHFKKVLEQQATGRGSMTDAAALKYGDYDKRKFFDAMLTTHDRFYVATNAFKCNVIWLSHSRAINTENKDASAQAKRKAVALPGFSTIEMAITGQAKSRYQADMHLYSPLIVAGNGKEKKVKLYPDGGLGWEGRSRYGKYLNETEEPHIGRILDKLKTRGEAK